MRAPIGSKIRNQRKSLGVSQVSLAERIGISASYLNLIEANKRNVGGALVQRIALALELDLDELTGQAEQKLIHELVEAATDPVFEGAVLVTEELRDLVVSHPRGAEALARLYRAYSDVQASYEAQSDRLRSDPLFSELLHQILSQITTVRSGSEILHGTDDLSERDRDRFLSSILREAQAMSNVAQTLIEHFDQSSERRKSVSPAWELDNLIFNERNYFPGLEDVAARLHAELAPGGHLDEAALTARLRDSFGVRIVIGGQAPGSSSGFPAPYRFDHASSIFWFQGSTAASTRKFQLARLYAELEAPEPLNAQVNDPRLTSSASRRLAFRAMASYLAGALVMPYSAFLRDADRSRYDIDFLAQTYGASFEQVAHRLVTLRRAGEEGIPFAFLRSDPAGRLTKHFPLPGLLLPSAGHACPLWAIYAAFRTPNQPVRQIVQFTDGSRYLFISKTVTRRPETYRDQPFHSSIMLACDVLYADRTIYGQGLDLTDQTSDIPVGPACRLCIRQDCAYRQEEAFSSSGDSSVVRGPLVPRRFDVGDTR